MSNHWQHLDTNSFFVSGIGDLPESKLCDLLSCVYVRMHCWEQTGEQRRFCEAVYSTIIEAEKFYNEQNPLKHNSYTLRFLQNQSMTSLWLSGLPGVVYSRDLFIGLTDLLEGLVRVSIPQHPEYFLYRIPGISSLGFCILTFSTHALAEEALYALKTPSRLYNQNYRVFMNRDIQVSWAEPFYDLLLGLSYETRLVGLSDLPIKIGTQQVEAALSQFGHVESLRRYANWSMAVMENVADAKVLLKKGGILIEGTIWNVKPAGRLNEDPIEPDLLKNSRQGNKLNGLSNQNEAIYELSALQLSTPDRQKLYETIQAAPAFPCTKENSVKGFSPELAAKAKKILQQSRKSSETFESLPGTNNKISSGAEPVKKIKINENKAQEVRTDEGVSTEIEGNTGKLTETKVKINLPGYAQSLFFMQNERLPALTPEQLQNLTIEQKMQYFYLINQARLYYHY